MTAAPTNSRPSRRVPVLAPLLVVAMLVAIAVQRGSYAGPDDYEPYHAAARAAVAAIPTDFGAWIGEDVPPQPAAVELLRPNAIRQVAYENISHGAIGQKVVASLLVVQCKRGRDMVGHFPLNCYPAVGWTLAQATPRRWDVAGRTIRGVEYAFTRPERGREARLSVYNFMILPGQGVVPDMRAVRAAADDYRRRYSGAAQVQVVFPEPLAVSSRARRDAAFAEVLQPALPAVDVLGGGLPAVTEDGGVAAAAD